MRGPWMSETCGPWLEESTSDEGPVADYYEHAVSLDRDVKEGTMTRGYGQLVKVIPLMLVPMLATCNSGGDFSPQEVDVSVDIDVGLPDRTEPPDTSRVTSEFRRNGGNAFVQLTGEPTKGALEVLWLRGLRAPVGAPSGTEGIVTFDSLQIRSVWGRIPGDGVDRIAGLLFVTRISPSEDKIGPQR